jgi:GxxExxY protein
MKHKELTSKILACAYKVHRELGFGFLESVYQNALMVELECAGLCGEKQRMLRVHYAGQVVRDFIADIVVENKVILELKAVKEMNYSHEAQLVNYLKATGIELGLLINFGESLQVKRKIFDGAR